MRMKKLESTLEIISNRPCALASAAAAAISHRETSAGDGVLIISGNRSRNRKRSGRFPPSMTVIKKLERKAIVKNRLRSLLT